MSAVHGSATTSEMSPTLSTDEIESYRARGWWRSSTPVLTAEEIAAARDAVESLYRDGIPESATTAHKPHLNWRPGDGDTMRVNNYAFSLHPALRALACHPAIGAIAAQLTGSPSIRLFNSSLVYKPAGDLSQSNSVGWHTDKAYWSTCTSSDMLTAWIPLHDVTPDRSPLTVLDRSHRWPAAEVGDLQRVRGFTAEQRDLIAVALRARSVDYQPISLSMPSGFVSFHHCLTFHGSAPNASDQPRISLTVHLQDASNRWRPALETDGTPVRYQHDDKVRRGPNGDPDYGDPTLCPTIRSVPPSRTSRTSTAEAFEPAALAAAVDADCVYLEGDGHLLLGRGTRRRWRVPQEDIRAGWNLARRELDDSRPVAFASLPFDRGEPASVRVPEELVWRGPAGWIRPPSPGLLSRRPMPPDGLDVSHSRVRSTVTARQWCADVRDAVERITSGELTKVVLARRIEVERNLPFAPAAVLRALRARFPGNHLFSIDGLVGASPELLVGQQDGELFALPLSGTTARSADPAADQAARAELLASAKLAREHDVTRQDVLNVFDEVCTTVKAGAEPTVISTATVHHLASEIRGVPRADAPPLLAIAARLHPTAAVCGHPQDAAYEFIRRVEPGGRGGYAGAVGWLDRDGNGRFAVAIRCVELDGTRAVIRVGNGIVGMSNPDDELAETRAKLRGLLESVVMP